MTKSLLLFSSRIINSETKFVSETEYNLVVTNRLYREFRFLRSYIGDEMPEKRCYTVQELQEILGVSRSMINKWVDKGKFTVIKVGGRVRIRRDEFEDWMEQRDLERSMQ